MLPWLPKCLLRLTRFSLFALLTCVLAVSSACSLFAPKYNRPNVTVSSIALRGGNLMQQNFAVKLHIQNPNDRDLPVRGIHAELNVGGEPIATGVSDHSIVIPAFGEADFDVTVTANMLLALTKLANRANTQSDSIDYDLTGAASIDLPFLRNLPFHQTGSLPLGGIFVNH
jgi:LEA14-like dessication related protein